ncbi:hypothetical protein [Crenothrix sp.]|uniref:glucosamine inositolphosphorylceramide transferase family protein n=1 Tax=Crenothrix sp. TaxID=3100433 RepID=UPI00374D5A9E
MKQVDFKVSLKVGLTAHVPKWAKSGIAALVELHNVDLLPTNDSCEPDVILHYGNYTDAACQHYGYGRLGFWFFRFAGLDVDAMSAGRHSAAAGLPLEVSLWARFPDGSCQCLYQSFGLLEPFIIKRGVHDALAKAAFFPARVVSSYFKTMVLPVCSAQSLQISSTTFVARFMEVKAIAQKIVRKLLYNGQWSVVAGVGNDMIPHPIGQWFLVPKSDCFWADPFPWEHEDRQWIFLEELPFSTQRGYLVAIELFKDGSHSDAQPVMIADTHLSYPFLFKWDGDLYMVPESGVARNIVLWKCVSFPNKWQQVTELLSDIRAVDATLIEYQGYWWMFVSVAKEGICIHDELHIYFSDTPLGTWQAHPENPVKSDARNARPAGNLFIEEGILYRPAQDCSTEYGKAVILNRVDRLNKHSFLETPIARLDASWYKDFLRVHTLSRSENLWAIDGFRWIARWRNLF